MKRHPLLVTAFSLATIVLVLLAPAAMAQGNGPGDTPCVASQGKNPHCYPITTGGTTTYEFRACPDGTTPPCKMGKKSFSSPVGRSIPIGVLFAVTGAGAIGYIALQRRRTLNLDA